MKFSDCLSFADIRLYKARRYLETSEAINWVCDEIGTGVLWTLTAWLIFHGYENDTYGGWWKVRVKFSEVGPKDIYSKASYCISMSGALGADLFGDAISEIPPMPFEQWKKETMECLERAEKVFELIKRDMDENGNPKGM